MFSEKFTLYGGSEFPYTVVAKRYRPKYHSSDATAGLTLLLVHGMGFHKETWEPMLERLFERTRASQVRIREAWAIDCPSHGDSAVFNSERLLQEYPEKLPISIHAKALRFLICNGPVNFHGHNLIAIGHSMGTVAMYAALVRLERFVIHSWSMLGTAPRLPYMCIILVEPWLSHPSDESKVQWQLAVGDRAAVRRDTWSSFEAAYQFMKERPFWKVWDDRVLKLYVTNGLKEITRIEDGKSYQQVTLKCPKVLEAAAVRSQEDRKTAYAHLPTLCSIPVHVIYGPAKNIFPMDQKMKIHNPQEGRVIQSIKFVEKAAHFIPLTHPDELANTFFAILSEYSPCFSTCSKL